MGGMRLDNDWTASRERGSGVAACDREGQGKVARSEHGHWPKADMAQPQIRAGQRRSVGHSRINSRIQMPAVAHDGSEEPQLPYRSSPFTVQPCTKQAGLSHCANDQLVAEIENAGGDELKKTRPFGWTSLPVHVERRPGEGACLFDLRAAGASEDR